MLKSKHTQDTLVEVGIDEAGRGCLWGPLVAAAVIWPEESTWTEELRAISAKIRDSKKLSPKRRLELNKQIQEHAIAHSIGMVTAQDIDSLGMTKSNRLAFQRALQGISVPFGRVIIDGILGVPGFDEVQQIIEPKGDDIYLSVAAASIIAKEGRDAMIKSLCEADPLLESRYSIAKSKGYGTLKHREAIKEHGMHANHRRLFLRKLLGLEHTISQGHCFIED